MPETWRISLDTSATSAPTYEAALEPFAIALTIFEAEPTTSKPRGLPEPATWAGDLWLADACVVEAIADHFPNLGQIEAAVAVAAASLNEPAPPVAIETIQDIDWQAKVLESLPAIEVGRFRVRGRHIEEPARPGIIDLEIEAGAAFGSGEHETTRACLEALTLVMKRERPRNVLDLGCGTGVLGLAAAKAAKADVLLTDIDARAVEVARAAARRNGAHLPARQADGWQAPAIQARAPYDLVLANILARPLRSMAGDLWAGLRPGGRAILSGFLYWQEAFVMAPHRQRGFVLEARIRRGDWLALVIRRAPRRRH